MMKNKKRTSKGSILIFSALLMVVFLGFGALAINIGHLFLVRNQLQNAADSIALTGAKALFPAISSGPNWSQSQTIMQSILSQFKIGDVTLSNATIQTGYWDLTQTKKGIFTISPPAVPSINDIPAVKVTISKSAGQNGGPVDLFFGSFLGLSAVDVSASSVAVSGAPSIVDPNTLYPIILPLSLYTTYWDSSNGKPLIDPLTGNPYTFQITSDGQNGNWTSFDTDENSVTAILNMMISGNPTSLKIGDPIWVQPGVKTSVYLSVPINVDVMVAIVDNTQAHASSPILGFGALHIDFALGGASKFIQGHLINNLKIESSTPIGGVNYGVYTPPKLAN